MARIYATEDGTGNRFLRRIECDGTGCSAFIQPNPDIAKSDWVKRGWTDSLGNHYSQEFCPNCQRQSER